jgi:hypothetical protein
LSRATGEAREPLLSRPVPAMLYGLAALLFLCAAVRSTLRAHADRELLETGEARWIWYTKELRQPVPLAFFATRDFLLEKVPARAMAKVFVDRRHVLFVNGLRAGSGTQRPGDPLLLWDLRPFLRVGLNRLAIQAQSANGVGGILFALDLDGAGRNAVVSDERWRVDLSPDAPRGGARFRAEVWGRPPMYPWNYPRMPRPNETTRSSSPLFAVRARTLAAPL